MLEWFLPRARAYPWRGVGNPYRVLVSEVMLQQTQAARVVPVYRSFLRRFPNVRALSAASRGEVLRAWDGLGYNRRAVALVEAARAIVAEFHGRIPGEPASLERLPGIGRYTAAAVASIGFGVAAPAVDTNARRIVARVFLGTDADDQPAERIQEFSGHWLDRSDPGRWNQALMDLGREVCRPRPRCHACPLAGLCEFKRAGRTPGPARLRQAAFEGSFRQVRGRVIRVLREVESASVAALARAAGEPIERVGRAIAALAHEGLVDAGPAAIDGRPSGRVRLAE